MNKKGLAIPTIILIIISISLLFTGIYTYIENTKKNENTITYQDQVDLIIEATKLWIKNNQVTGDIKITLCELQKNDYIGELIDPIKNQKIPNDSTIIYENKNYTFKEGKNNLKVCSTENKYLEVDITNENPVEIPKEYENINKIIIKENGEEVEKIHINKKTTYEIIYILNDDSIKTNYIIVRDTTPPTININLNNYKYNENTNTIEINKYETFNLPKAIIIDNSASKLKIDTISDVNSNCAGNYKIKYIALDEDENKTEKIINVVVKSNNTTENYYIETNKYTNTKEINLKLKGLNTKEICISNNSICNNWISYTEQINWTLENNNKIYVYYKTNDEKIHMKTMEIILDTEKPTYISSNKVLYGITYNLNEIINAEDTSGIKKITNNSVENYKPTNFGLNKLSIEILDNANNSKTENIELTTYKILKCDNSISSIENEDGLIKNENNCIFVGKNPNNYIKVNNELYRIIEIEKNNKIKIIKEQSISQELNNNIWNISNLKTYLNNYYNNQNQTILTNGYFYYGDINNSQTVKNIYENSNKNYEISYIALPSITDYLKAGKCNETITYDKILNNNPCKENNWMYTKEEYWLINTISKKVSYVTNEGNISYTYAGKKEVKPVMYLQSNLGIIKGNGTKENPYIIDETISTPNLSCNINTTKEFETSKTLTVETNENSLVSFDGINFSTNNKINVSEEGIITAYIKENKEYTSCSIRLYKEYEYRYKDCAPSNITYDDWYVVGTVREKENYEPTSKNIAILNNLNHYEEINETPCNNCKWVTKYERKATSCKNYDNVEWSSWTKDKPEEKTTRIIDTPKIKYGIK